MQHHRLDGSIDCRTDLVAADIVPAMLLDPDLFIAGDRRTVHLFATAARQWAQRYFDDPAVLDSIVQTSLLEMTDQLLGGAAPEHERLVFWIYTRTHNVVRRELRRVRKHDVDAFESHMHGRAPTDMSQVLRLKRELEQLEAALDFFDSKAREIFVDHVRGEPYREIAKTHDVSEGAARQSVHETRKHLTQILAANSLVRWLRKAPKRFHGRRPSPPTESSDSHASR